VLSRAEVARLLEHVEPAFAPIVGLLYGAGLRLMECLRLRVKDVDFDRKVLIVREGKGRKDRVVMLPEPLTLALRRQLEHSRAVGGSIRVQESPEHLLRLLRQRSRSAAPRAPQVTLSRGE
jgi:integrase